MSELLLIPVGLLIIAVLGTSWLNIRLLRDELTANRMERAELLQRIQAPASAVAEHSYKQVKEEVLAQTDFADHIDQEWEQSPDSIVEFDEDLAQDYVT